MQCFLLEDSILIIVRLLKSERKVMKKYLIPVFLFLADAVAFGKLMFNVLSDGESYQFLTVKYVLHYVLLISAVVSLIIVVLSNRRFYDFSKYKKIFISVVCVVVVGCVALCTASCLTVESFYDSFPVKKGSDGKMNEFFTFSNYNVEMKTSVEYDSCMMCQRLYMWRYNTEIEYFKSKSALLNKKSALEKSSRLPIGYDSDVIDFDPEEINVDGINMLLSVRGDDYKVLINDSFTTFCMQLTSARLQNISQEDFVNDAARQYKKIKQMFDDNTVKTDLDISLS